MIKNFDLMPLYLSFYLGIVTTLFLIIISLPLSWWLAKTKRKILKKVVEIIVCLPLVLPPTILGFYLLLIFGNSSFLGKIWFNIFGFNIVFSMSGLVLGSIIYSLPFAIQPVQLEFEKISQKMIDQVYVLQFSKVKTFFRIIFPLSKNGILKAIILSFAHTLGEFGVVLMLGGNIHGKTQVISIAIYESVELLDYTRTHLLSLVVILISFLILSVLFLIGRDGVKD